MRNAASQTVRVDLKRSGIDRGVAEKGLGDQLSRKNAAFRRRVDPYGRRIMNTNGP